MRHLQLGLPADRASPSPRSSRTAKPRQRRTPAARTCRARSSAARAAARPSRPDEGGHVVIRSVVAQHHEVGVHLLGRAPLFARYGALGPQPTGQLLGKRIELARPLGNLEFKLNLPGAQVLADRVARQTRATFDLPDRISSRKCQRRITLNKAMSITPVSPDQAARGRSEHGSLLSGNYAPPGSALSGNQHYHSW